MISTRRLFVLWVSGESEMVNRDFFSSGAGERYTENISGYASNEVKRVESFFYMLALAHRAGKERPEMEAARDELQVRIQDTREKMAELDKLLSKRPDVKLQAERDALSSRVTQDRSALTQVKIVLGWINNVPAPEPPVWFVEWLDTFRRE